MEEGKTRWSTGLMVTMHMQITVTFTSMILQIPISTISPRRVSTSRSKSCSCLKIFLSPCSERGPTSWISPEDEQLFITNAGSNTCPTIHQQPLSLGSDRPYKPPVRNNADRPILSFFFNCKFLTTKIGAINMTKSVTIQGIGPNRRSSRTFPQCFSIVGCHVDRIGEQIKASAAVRLTHHRSMKMPRTRTAIWNLRVMKIR